MHRILALSLLLTLSFFSCTSSPKGKLLDAKAFQKMMTDTKDKVVLDVRTPGEFSEGYIKDAQNMDWNNSSFMSEAGKLNKSTPTFVYCRSGGRSHSAANALRDMGFTDVYELDGGIMRWQSSGLPLETGGSSNNHAPELKGMSMQDYNNLQNTDKLVLIDFYAPWCGPCKQMEPFLKEIAAEQTKVLDLHKIDADQNTALSDQLNITGLPTLLMYKNKKLVWSHMGYVGKDELLEKISTFK